MSGNKTADRYSGIKEKIIGYAERDDDIRAVIMIGSSVRDELPADEYSDLDLIIVTREPEKWFSGEYPELFGDLSISFIEPTLGGGKERRSIYDDDKDVDMIILTPVQFESALTEGVAEWVMNRGYRLLYDAGGYSEAAAKYVKLEVPCTVMTEEEYANTINDFCFHIIWSGKKLLRGEVWAAKMCIDAYLKERLLKMLEQSRIAEGHTDIWHDGRFIDRRADVSVLNELKECFAHYDTEDCRRALAATFALFVKLAETVAKKRGYSRPEKALKCAERFLDCLAQR